MTTLQRADALAACCRNFPELGIKHSDQLLQVVTAELGHPNILDRFQSYGPGDLLSQAIAPERILHIVSGNTPLAALQSLIRGLLIGSENFCKIPSIGLPEISRFESFLPRALAEKVQISTDLPDEWLRSSQVVIVFGNDETIHQLRQRCRPDQGFLPHGHRLSFGIIEDDAEGSLDRAARDISRFDQKGCLSLHTLYVHPHRVGSVHDYGKALGTALEAYNQIDRRSDLTVEEEGDIQNLRSSYGFRAANDPRVSLQMSEQDSAWTVICEEDPAFAESCLNRLVFVKPLPEKLAPHLTSVANHLSTIALWPFEPRSATRYADLGASRLCALGESQNPSFLWHQDGQQTLANMVRWIDIG